MSLRNLLSGLAMVTISILSIVYMTTIGLSATDKVGVRNATMAIPATNGLVEGSRVLLRGVSIGKVTAVTPSIGGVQVDWNYSEDVRIPVDSDFRVDNLSALGEPYVSVLPNVDDGPSLADNAVLDMTDVYVPPTVDELSARLTIFLEQINAEKVDRIVGEVNVGLVDDDVVLSHLARAGALLESTMLSTRGDFETLLDKFQSLLNEGSDIGPYLRDSADPMVGFASGLGVFLDRAVPFIITANIPTSLNDGVGPFFEDLQVFLDKVAPDLYVLGNAGLPAVTAATDALQTVNLSQLLATSLAVDGSRSSVVLNVLPSGN